MNSESTDLLTTRCFDDGRPPSVVMAVLVTAIHVFLVAEEGCPILLTRPQPSRPDLEPGQAFSAIHVFLLAKEGVDGRDEHGHDDSRLRAPPSYYNSRLTGFSWTFRPASLLGSCSGMHLLVYLSHGWLDLHHDKPAERHAVRRRSERSTTPSLSAPRRSHRRIHETIRIENARLLRATR